MTNAWELWRALQATTHKGMVLYPFTATAAAPSVLKPVQKHKGGCFQLVQRNDIILVYTSKHPLL